MIETSVYETIVKPSPLRKRLRLVRLILVAILMLCFTMPLPSAAAPGTNSFTGSASVPDQITFATTGSLNIRRHYHTATLLDNGKVLVAGGYNNGLLASAELYDPATGIWSNTGSMNFARNIHTATLLENGKVLVAGGYGGGDNSAELYDPNTGTWNSTGNLNHNHSFHTSTLLGNGKVLVAGGSYGVATAELYDPVTGNWSNTGSMNTGRQYHTATLLNNGQVLVAGGFNYESYWLASAELYDPVTGTWITTGSMNDARYYHTATLLDNGKVLVAGGEGDGGPSLSSSELYDPATGTWSLTGSMNSDPYNHTATLLNNGKVLVVGGSNDSSYFASTEFFNPVMGTWNTSGNMNNNRDSHTSTLLNDGKLLIAGGYNNIYPNSISNAELGTLIPGNTFTGTLTLPSEWLKSTTITTQFVGKSSAAAINAGALSNDNNTWGSWIAATPDVVTTTTWTVSNEGANKPVYLRLRDINDQITTVVTGTVNVDLTKPTSTMTALPATSPANISLSWSGSDALSGLSTYDVQVRTGIAGAWTDVLSNTTNTSTNYIIANGITYYFRTRASDVAGNVEDWPPDYDTFTIVDTDAPTVVSSVRANPNPTKAASVHFTVTFSEAVTGVDTADFSLTAASLTGTSVTGVSGSGMTYTVTVNTGSGSGTLQLNVIDNDTILDSGSNPLGGTGAGNGSFNSGQFYTLDRTSPTVLSSIRVNPNPTTATTVYFIVTFSEPVTGVDTTDFNLTTTGISFASVVSVSGSGTTYTITVNTGSGFGTLRLDVTDNDSIWDMVHTPLGGVGLANGNFTSGETYTIGVTPLVVSISGNTWESGVTLSYTDGTPKTVISDGNGNYSLTVTYNWSGIVTPSKTGYTFNPASITYTNVLTDQTGQNYVAPPITYTISGNTWESGVTLSYIDGTPKTLISDGSGNYSLTVTYNWSGAVTPSKAGYAFSPENRTYTNVVENQTAQNYTAVVVTFTDVSNSYWAWSWIERLYAAGVTSGCSTNPMMYCPEDSVTRAQMAIFLERGKNGSAYTPPSATGMVFIDVSAAYWAAAWIEKLYADGITVGCATNPLRYCPEDPVTRSQMAIFLLRAKYGAAYVPPGVGSNTGFNDVPVTYWAAAWIEQLYAEGITTGCGTSPLTYCPDSPTTRAEMAVFLLKAEHGAAYIPPGVGSSTGFNDVLVTHWAAAWIKQLAAEGITTGCGSGNYCPEDSVTRAQMAVFLVRTFNLP